jgi:uncharacterized protein (DUF433 family)
MSTLEEAEALLSRMTPGEKAQLPQRVAQESRDAYPGIDTIDGVCGGEPVIVRTRIPVWVLEQARRLGSTEADLLRLYPGLLAEDLAWCAFRAAACSGTEPRRHHRVFARFGLRSIVSVTFDQ